MNIAASARVRRRGYAGWTGAVNTDYDPLDPATAAQPFDAYRALHVGGRVHYNPRRATWILSRHEDIRAALRDTEAITSTLGVTRMKISAPILVLTDGDDHARLRRQVQPGFTKGAMSEWQAMANRLAEELVADVVAHPGCDVMERLAMPLPIRMIAHIIGIPPEDVENFRSWSERGVGIINAAVTPAGLRHAFRGIRAIAALRRYFKDQLASGRLKGADTVLGRLVDSAEDGMLSDDELFFIAMLLLFAGNETTTNLIGGMFDTLAHSPDQFAMIRDNPDLIPSAVEEQLRYSTPIQNLYRYTRTDYKVGEVTIPSGSRLLLAFGAANRDPEVFEDPDSYRADRNPRNHIAFGYGAHMCIGATLTRVEGHAVLRELASQASAITAAGTATWSTNSSLRGPTRLPIRLTPAR
ncbi:MAG: cytochrome P450 [Mycobacterium sp.]